LLTVTRALPSHRADRRGPARRRPRVPKLPSFIQEQLDELIEKGERDELNQRQRAQLHKVLDYVDAMTIVALQRLVRARAAGSERS